MRNVWGYNCHSARIMGNVVPKPECIVFHYEECSLNLKTCCVLSFRIHENHDWYGNGSKNKVLENRKLWRGKDWGKGNQWKSNFISGWVLVPLGSSLPIPRGCDYHPKKSCWNINSALTIILCSLTQRVTALTNSFGLKKSMAIVNECLYLNFGTIVSAGLKLQSPRLCLLTN